MRKLFCWAFLFLCCVVIVGSSVGFFQKQDRLFSSFEENRLCRLEYRDGKIRLYRNRDVSPYMEWSSLSDPFPVEYYTSPDDAARAASARSD